MIKKGGKKIVLTASLITAGRFSYHTTGAPAIRASTQVRYEQDASPENSLAGDVRHIG